MSHIFVSDKRTHLLVEVARAETMTSPHRCLRNRGTVPTSKYGMRWMSGGTKRQRDRPPPYADLARVVAGVAAVEHVGLADEGGGEGGGPPRRGRGLGLEAVLRARKGVGLSLVDPLFRTKFG